MEFNSLSVVYKKPAEKFLKDAMYKQHLAVEKKYFQHRKDFAPTETPTPQGEVPKEKQSKATPEEQPPSTDLLDFGAGIPDKTAVTMGATESSDLLGGDLLGVS